MLDETELREPRKPRTLPEIESLGPPSPYGRYQFSLGKLMIQAPLLGLIVAIVVKTQGVALQIAIAVGVCVAFMAPVIALIYIAGSGCWGWLRKRWRKRRPAAQPTKPRRQRDDRDVSFDELE